MNEIIDAKHFHLCCGTGGGARGFNLAKASISGMNARFRCIGGVDNDTAGLRDFRTMTGVEGTFLDLFDRGQYIEFHDHEPPTGWREATPEDIRKAAGGEFPNFILCSSPCKGLSGLLSEKQSKTKKYQALNRLTVRTIFLACEAFKDDLPEFFLFENVPRIQNRGRHLLDQIQEVLRSYNYAVAETVHDCGEIGGLAQHRKRFLLVARNTKKVRPFLYEPPKKRLLSVGDVLGKLPVPGEGLGGPMHRIPELQWKTWVRLAFVEAGKDWRSLSRLRIKDEVLQDYLLVPEMHNGVLGIQDWGKPAGTVAGASRPMNGKFSVADPRTGIPENRREHFLGVGKWSETSGAVSGRSSPTNGRYAVADPRFNASGSYGQYGVRGWKDQSGTVTSQRSPGQGGFSVADPRAVGLRGNAYKVVKYSDTTGAVCGESFPSNGGFTVADPRLGWGTKRKNYQSGGHFGVVKFDEQTGAVTGSAGHDSGKWSVADPRPLPEGDEKLVARIIAEDGTWHRPFTTLELAALQGFLEEWEGEFKMDGGSDTAHRERIGNAIPSPAAQAIASEMGRALLLARSGQSFQLGSTPIWVRPVVTALSVDQAH